MVQKQNYMKLLLTGILFSLICYSCGTAEIDKASYILETLTNNSGKNLSIEKWDGGISQIYNLKKDQIIEFEVELFTGSCLVNGNSTNNVNSNYCLITTSDSIKIIFEDNKSIILKPNDAREINILNIKNYKYSQNGNKQFYKYLFTMKDYLEAK